jgi:spermidine/putrescine transport system permease protein
MTMKKRSEHEFRSDIVPAAVMVGPVAAIMVFLVVIPLIYVIVMSFCSVDAYYNVVYSFTLKNYALLADPEYIHVYVQSLVIAFLTTAVCLAVAYPFSYLIARTKSRKKQLLYMLVIIPFWTNSLIRIYGWRTFLGTNGWLNSLLQFLHITDAPVQFLFNRGTTVLGMVYCLMPFMIMPLYTSIEKLDASLLEASADLGAKRSQTFWKVIIPLTRGGIFSGSIMVFIPCLGFFYVADILGGGNSDVIGNLIQRQFQSGNNWPLGATLSIILIAVTLVLLKIYQKIGGNMEDLGV